MTIQRWSDDAMFHAEPMATTNGLPQIHLLSMNSDPLGSIASMARMYEGKPCYKLSDITDDERRRYFESIQKTKLQAPFESVKLHFFIENISRSTTHQMVRQRTAVYSQESLRFAVKDEITVVEPPTIRALRMLAHPTPTQQMILEQWDKALGVDWESYNFLIENGIPAEDARELLPHATATRIHYVTDLRNLVEHAGNRLCTQAVPVWRAIFTGIVSSIRDYVPDDFSWVGTETSSFGSSSRPVLLNEWRERFGWQFETIADSMLFRPACYQQGRCPFSSDIDRGCTIRERVNYFSKRGVPSEKWDEVYEETFNWSDPLPWARLDSQGQASVDIIPAIRPEEWLLDINAGRTHRKES